MVPSDICQRVMMKLLDVFILATAPVNSAILVTRGKDSLATLPGIRVPYIL